MHEEWWPQERPHLGEGTHYGHMDQCVSASCDLKNHANLPSIHMKEGMKGGRKDRTISPLPNLLEREAISFAGGGEKGRLAPMTH